MQKCWDKPKWLRHQSVPKAIPTIHGVNQLLSFECYCIYITSTAWTFFKNTDYGLNLHMRIRSHYVDKWGCDNMKLDTDGKLCGYIEAVFRNIGHNSKVIQGSSKCPLTTSWHSRLFFWGACGKIYSVEQWDSACLLSLINTQINPYYRSVTHSKGISDKRCLQLSGIIR